MLQENQSNNIHQEFGSEVDVEQITGRKRRTLQKDRCSGRGFPFYRVGRKILYDLSEVRELIRAARVDTAGAVTPSRDTAGAALKGVRL